MASTRYSMWPPGVVEAVCKVLASTDWPGLTGSELGRLLAMRGFEDVAPGEAKWRRLEAAMQTRQQRDRASNCLIRFIADAMEPSRYVSDPGRFSALRVNLTEALALVGLKVTERGQIGRAAQASTLDEVAKLAGRLHTELTRRGVHQQILTYCNEELIRRSLFHAVFEAVKGLAARLRALSGSVLDGGDLIDHCFAGRSGPPVIQINLMRPAPIAASRLASPTSCAGSSAPSGTRRRTHREQPASGQSPKPTHSTSFPYSRLSTGG